LHHVKQHKDSLICAYQFLVEESIAPRKTAQSKELKKSKKAVVRRRSYGIAMPVL